MSILDKPARVGDHTDLSSRVEVEMDWEELERGGPWHAEPAPRPLVCRWVPDDRGRGLKSVWITGDLPASR